MGSLSRRCCSEVDVLMLTCARVVLVCLCSLAKTGLGWDLRFLIVCGLVGLDRKDWIGEWPATSGYLRHVIA